MNLDALGWNAQWEAHFSGYRQQGYAAGRISSERKNLYTVLTEAHGEIPAVPTGKFYYEADDRNEMPVVGDWVVIRIHDGGDSQATIHAVLPRQTKFSRKEPGKRALEQPVAANIDTAFLVTGLDGDYNVRRIERYAAMAWESGAAPVVLLTKADLCPDVGARLHEMEAMAPGIPVLAVSVLEQTGLDALAGYLAPGSTLVLLGSSGAGKSTLLNHLLGHEVQRVQEVRRTDSHGRHTTTQRQLFLLPCGALVIDTPGMRELQLWDAGDGVSETFADVEELAARCRYADCTHRQEPGCRIREALESGQLDPRRFESYTKLNKELAYQAARTDRDAEQARRDWRKKISKLAKQIKKERG